MIDHSNREESSSTVELSGGNVIPLITKTRWVEVGRMGAVITLLSLFVSAVTLRPELGDKKKRKKGNSKVSRVQGS